MYSKTIFKEDTYMKVNIKIIGAAVAAVGAFIAGGVFTKPKKDEAVTPDAVSTNEATTTATTTVVETKTETSEEKKPE